MLSCLPDGKNAVWICLLYKRNCEQGRQEWKWSCGTAGGGDLISAKRLEMVMTEWFTLIKWDRDLSHRAGRQGKVRKAEGVCVELASDGKGPEEGPWCCEALRRDMRCMWKMLGRLKADVWDYRSPHTGKGQLEPGGLEVRTTALLLLWHSCGQGTPGDLLGFLWSHWKELGYSTIINSHSHPPMLLIIWGIVWRTFPPPSLSEM